MSDLPAAPAERVKAYDALAEDIENDEPTSFTADDVFEATVRLADAATSKVVAARHIRDASGGQAMSCDPGTSGREEKRMVRGWRGWRGWRVLRR